MKSFMMKENITFFSIIHTSHYLNALKMFKDSPIFGKGPKTIENTVQIASMLHLFIKEN